MFEVINHTADIGLRIWAATLEDLFREAAEGMFWLLVEDPAAIREETAVEIDVAADSGFVLPSHGGPGESRGVLGVSTPLSEEWADLLHDWLAELLVAFDSRHWVFRRFDVQFATTGLRGRAWGEKFHPERHRPRMEIKAVTYHGLEIYPTERGYETQVIFDL
ncbi:MAG: archease [Thermogutta sp.]